MWIVVGTDDIIIAVASIEANNQSHLDNNPGSVSIELIVKPPLCSPGDSYIVGEVIPDMERRKAATLRGVKIAMIETSLREDKAGELGFVDIKQEYTNELSDLNAEKTELEK